MKIADLSRHALRFCAAATMLSGCGAAQSQIGGLGAVPESPATATQVKNGRPWIAPDAKKKDLLYISDRGTNDVYVYSYPRGKLNGTLTGFNDPDGECVDKTGDVFITNFLSSNIIEYAHGGTSPIATLSDPGYYPADCSVDPTLEISPSQTSRLRATSRAALRSTRVLKAVLRITRIRSST